MACCSFKVGLPATCARYCNKDYSSSTQIRLKKFHLQSKQIELLPNLSSSENVDLQNSI